MNNDLEQYTIEKIKQLTMAIDQSAFTAIRDRLIDEKAMAEIALKAMQAKSVGYIEEKAKGTDSFILKGFYKNNINVGDAVYTTPPANSPAIPDGWIKCSERMPEEGGRYLAWVNQQNSLGLSSWADNVGYQPDDIGFRFNGQITHWMPLPPPPAAAPKPESE